MLELIWERKWKLQLNGREICATDISRPFSRSSSVCSLRVQRRPLPSAEAAIQQPPRPVKLNGRRHAVIDQLARHRTPSP
jgi:hypothetical protein